MISLNDWAEIVIKRGVEMPNRLPDNCPNCSRIMNQIRFVHDRETMIIRLTGVVRESQIHRALCPHCAHQLDSYTLTETP